MTTLEFILIIVILLITALSIVAIVYYEQKNSCTHKWKIIDEIDLVVDEESKTPCGTKYVLQCEKCGDIKIKSTIK